MIKIKTVMFKIVSFKFTCFRKLLHVNQILKNKTAEDGKICFAFYMHS